MAVQANLTDSHLTSTVVNAPTAGGAISITTWMTATWSTSATVKSLVGIYGPSAAAPITAIQIGSRITDNAVYVWTYGGGVLINTTSGVVNDGQLHFIAYTTDGTTHRLYVDGVLQATSTTGQIAGQFNTFYINGFPPGGTLETSTHVVESVRMYDRELAPAEITAMYVSRGARHNITFGLIAYYEFDEGAQGAGVNTCFDMSGTTPPANLTWIGTGSIMTYSHSTGESKTRPPVVN